MEKDPRWFADECHSVAGHTGAKFHWRSEEFWRDRENDIDRFRMYVSRPDRGSWKMEILGA